VTERPRDSLGRPLRRGADPSLAAEPVADVSALADAQVWALAADYLQRGLPFHAHEVFEARWRSAGDADRVSWRALAQWGAALTHEARGNVEGSRRLAERALETLDKAGSTPDGVDIARVRESCARLLRP
jgi:predicted metal-dependent hydrolase